MSTLRERNQKMIEKATKMGPELESFTQEMKTRFGLNMWDEKQFPVNEPGFSFKALRESVSAKIQAGKFRETDVSTGFTQFLRAGVQLIASKGYQMTETTFEDWVRVVPSKLDTELYAPSHGVAFPRQVGQDELYPEVGQAALNLSLKNLKFGSMFVVSQELANDDQTGQVQEQASLLGGYLKILTEVLCYGKLASVSGMQYADYKIPVSETKPSNETNWPYTLASAPFIGGGFNKPAAYGMPSIATFNAARVALMNQKNLQGLKMGIRGNRILCGPQISFDVVTLLNSQFYPVGASAAGVVGGNYAVNPVKGLYTMTQTPFMFKSDGTVNGDSTAWYVTDDTKTAFVLQLRQAVQVEQEAPNSGESFNKKVYRYRADMRGNADFIDSRFFWQGNNGSVTS